MPDDWTVKVECAFTTVPSDPSPVWVDITAWAIASDGVPVQIVRGRPDQFTEVAPSTATIQLDNSDGRFTPGNVASPYYPNVKKGRRLRVKVDYPVGGTTYYRYDGYVDQWPHQWPGGSEGYATATITCSDRLKRLGRIGNLRSILEQEILAPAGPEAYYTLGEPEGSASAGNTSDVVQPPLTIAQIGSGGTISFGTGTGPGTDEMPAAVFTRASADNGKYLTSDLSATIGGAANPGVSLRASFLTSTAGLACIASLENVYGSHIELSVDATGKLRASAVDAFAGSHYLITSAGSVADGVTHDATVVQSWAAGSVTATLYLDGVSVGTAVYSWWGNLAASKLVVGGRPGELPFNGTLSHVAVYNVVLTSTQIADQRGAGTTGFVGDSSDERIARLATYAGIAPADVVTEVGDSTSLVAQNTAGQSPLSLMRAVEVTEAGLLFIDTQGRLTFHARSHRFNVDPAVVLSAANGDISPDIAFVVDDQFLVNDLTVTSPGGATTRVVSQSSIDDYDPYVDTLEVLSTSDLEVADIGYWRVNQYGDPQPRCPQVGVALHGRAGESGFTETFVDIFMGESVMPPTVIGLELGAKIRLSDLPANAPAPIVDLFVEGYTENIGAEVWTMEFNTSPAGVSTSVWQLDDPVYSVLGSTTRLAY